MATTQGMLGGLFAAPSLEDDALQYARLGNPNYAQEAYRMRQGQNMLEQGVGRVATGLAGGTNDEKARDELRALAKTVKPGTPEFFDQAAMILTKYGMVDKAAEMTAKAAAERRAQEAHLTGQVAGKGEYERLLNAKEKAMAAGNMPMVEAIQKRLDALNTKPTGSPPAASELGKLIAEQKQFPQGSPEWNAYDARIRALMKIKSDGPEIDPALIPGTKEWKRIKDVEAREGKEGTKQEALDATTKSKVALGVKRAQNIAKFARRAEGLITAATTGIPGAAAKLIPNTDAYNLDKALDSMRSNIGFAELQAMREAAKTGGALGQVSDFENRMLQSTQGSLDQGQSAELLRRNVMDIRLASEAVIAALGGAAPAASPAPAAASTAPAPAAAPAAPAKPKLTIKRTE